MDISFAIVNWKGGKIFEKSIDSINTSIKNSNLRCEIIVIDNASNEDEISFLKNYKNVTLITNMSNRGFAEGTNQSLRRCIGKYVFILNNDVILETVNLNEIYDFMERNPDIGVIAPMMKYPDGRLQKNISGLPTLSDIFYYSTMLSRIGRKYDHWKQNYFDYTKACEAEQPMFSALFIRKIVWDGVGELDERFPIFFNDVDWFLRFHILKKWKCLYYPRFTCIHYHGMSVNKNVFKKVYYFTSGMYKYFTKNHHLTVISYLFLIFLCVSTFICKIIIDLIKKRVSDKYKWSTIINVV